ncbi:unnamed protein product [Mucor hiemalis]
MDTNEVMVDRSSDEEEEVDHDVLVEDAEEEIDIVDEADIVEENVEDEDTDIAEIEEEENEEQNDDVEIIEEVNQQRTPQEIFFPSATAANTTSFAPPLALKPLLPPPPPTSTISPKPLKFNLPPILPVDTPTTASSSSDVQRRTFVSKGGNVDVESVIEPESELEFRLLNWNKSKRLKFKPVAPERKIKKQRLFSLRPILNRILTHTHK